MEKDLLLLTACQNIKAAVLGVISNPKKSGIRTIDCNAIIHPEHDPGCRINAASILQSQRSLYSKALVVFDREGSGCEEPAESISKKVKDSLEACGWKNKCEVVVIDPELEIWAWSESPAVDQVLGWNGKIPSLRSWLLQSGYINPPQIVKPLRPKEVLDEALEMAGIRRTSVVFTKLAGQVSYERCVDCAFVKLLATLRKWFPPE